MSTLALEVVDKHLRAVGLNHRSSVRQDFAIDFLLVTYSCIVIVAILNATTNLAPQSVYPESLASLYNLLEDFVLTR